MLGDENNNFANEGVELSILQKLSNGKPMPLYIRCSAKILKVESAGGEWQFVNESTQMIQYIRNPLQSFLVASKVF